MTDDAQLLRQYVDRQNEDAFAELVQRHLGLVYHAAIRQLGARSHLAEDVVQNVFVLLARKSRSLRAHPSLVAWLHTTTRFKVAEALRAERRREQREEAAQLVDEATRAEPGATEWQRLRPLIDEVLLELNEADREAVLLRFFAHQPFADIAARLRLSEGATHKRVERAVEKLRAQLGRRGIHSTAGALATIFGGHAALGAPPGLAAAVTSAALSSGLPAAATWSLLSLMSTKTAATVSVIVLVVTGGVATHQAGAERAAADTLAKLEQDNAALAARLHAVPPVTTRVVAKQPAAVNASASPVPASVTRALGRGGLASVEESQAFLAANPDVREALAAAFRASLGREYAGLIASLGLSDAEREEFLSILASGRRRIVGEHQFSLGDTMVSGPEITRRLRALLGEARYQQYRDYRNGAVPRDLAGELTRSLYFTATPLTALQATELQRIVSRAIAEPAPGSKSTAGAWPYIPAPAWDRIVADAGVALTEPQVEALRELQQRSAFFHAQSAASAAWRAKQEAGKQNAN